MFIATKPDPSILHPVPQALGLNVSSAMLGLLSSTRESSLVLNAAVRKTRQVHARRVFSFISFEQYTTNPN